MFRFRTIRMIHGIIYWASIRFDRNRVKVGDRYSACYVEELVATKVDYWNGDVIGKGVDTGIIRSCSIKHCGVEKVKSS